MEALLMPLCFKLSLLLASFATALPAFAPNPALASRRLPIRIGVLPTMSRGAEPQLTNALKDPLLAEVEAQTGVDCKFEVLLTINQMRRWLQDGRLHFALCHGFEFAWMNHRDPKIKPLMIAASMHRPLKVFVVVTESSPAQSLCDLREKTIAIPKKSHATVRLFADRQCRCEGDAPWYYAKEITRPENPEMALHDLCDGIVDAAIVDGAGLQSLQERYPARSKLLRVIKESEPFPLSVVVYREGILSPSMIRHFQEVMQKTHTTGMGRQFLSLMHSTGFEAVPLDYEQRIKEFVKRYPPRGILPR
jgi:ABC-type phosphate/phosphonate transport system substrate-binding protein